jgi:glycosyltransferase involved in cell wall biosynthesis
MRRVYFIGLRGFPGVQGGIETHVENLVLELSKHDAAIWCFGRSRFRRQQSFESKVNWIWLWAPRQQGLETFFHSLLCVIFLAFMRRGVAHLHGIGPGAFSPFLRMLGYRVIVTHHGYDYARAKWGKIASAVLKIGEFLSVHYAHAVISVSKHVAEELSSRFLRKIYYVPNGMPQIEITNQDNASQSYDEVRPFFLMASRFVPEKRIHDAIQAFSKLKSNCVALLIAGSADVPGTGYDAWLRRSVPSGFDVVFLGSVSHDVLWILMRKCLAFINASSHEGLPIAVLEACAQRAQLILSDIPAHREFSLPDSAYYAIGDTDALAHRMKSVLEADVETTFWRIDDEKMEEYSWNKVIKSVMSIYGCNEKNL